MILEQLALAFTDCHPSLDFSQKKKRSIRAKLATIYMPCQTVMSVKVLSSIVTGHMQYQQSKHV